VKEKHHAIFQILPPAAKISLALDRWTSPFQQAFMAVTGYLIDQEWSYREALRGFEPLHGTHSGANLSDVLLGILHQYGIVDRVLTITTDNASNNNTLMEKIQEPIQILRVSNHLPTIRVPCLAPVIQLSLKELLGHIKADPKNDVVFKEWSHTQTHPLPSNIGGFKS